MTITDFEAWVAKARAVLIEEEVERRGISLRGKIDRCGPCPRCGGEDRFSINVREQLWNCRKCKTKQDKVDVIGFVQFTATVSR
jgi:ribosomal protein L37AE/L43A